MPQDLLTKYNALEIARELFPEEVYTDGFVCDIIWNNTGYVNQCSEDLFRKQIKSELEKQPKLEFLSDYGRNKN